MKMIMKLAGMGAVLALGLGVAQAQTTNVVMTANIALSGFKQVDEGNASPVRITTKDIIAALNASGGFGFGNSAQLIMISQEDQLPTFAVREHVGTNVNTTDVSSYLSIEEAIEVHANNNAISYVAQTFNFDDHNGTSFSVTGFTTLHRGRISARGIAPLSRVNSLTAQVAGY